MAPEYLFRPRTGFSGLTFPDLLCLVHRAPYWQLGWPHPGGVAGIARRVFNPTQPMSLAAVYDPQLARRVYDLYIADFETFGYHKDSWRDE